MELATTALLIAPLVKYGELFFEFPFSTSPGSSAFNMIFFPSVFVALQYQFFKQSPKVENERNEGGNDSGNGSEQPYDVVSVPVAGLTVAAASSSAVDRQGN